MPVDVQKFKPAGKLGADSRTGAVGGMKTHVWSEISPDQPLFVNEFETLCNTLSKDVTLQVSRLCKVWI